MHEFYYFLYLGRLFIHLNIIIQVCQHSSNFVFLFLFLCRPTMLTSAFKAVIVKSPSKSCELDPVPTFIIKQCVDVIVPHLTLIVNKSLQPGHFPDSLKVAHIRPLLKKTGLDIENSKNYRPVSNLTFLGKIIERVVSIRMSEHNFYIL